MSRLALCGPLVLALAAGADPRSQTRPGSGPGPQGAPSARREQVLEVARRIMSASRYCTLVTLGPKHEPQARIVDPMEPNASFEVYIATNPRSRKVDEIRKDPRVTLLYFDPAAKAYATVIGRAVEVRGVLKTTQYKKEWQGFFSLDAPDSYTLYKVLPSRMEVVSPKDGLSGDPATWRPDILDLK